MYEGLFVKLTDVVNLIGDIHKESLLLGVNPSYESGFLCCQSNLMDKAPQLPVYLDVPKAEPNCDNCTRRKRCTTYTSQGTICDAWDPESELYDYHLVAFPCQVGDTLYQVQFRGKHREEPWVTKRYVSAVYLSDNVGKRNLKYEGYVVLRVAKGDHCGARIPISKMGVTLFKTIRDALKVYPGAALGQVSWEAIDEGLWGAL